MKAYTRSFPVDADGWYNLGTALHRVGRFDSAVRALRQAVKVRPNFGEAYFNLGLALDQAGFAEDAIQALRRAALVNANLAATSYNSMAIVLRLQGRIDEALEAHRQAISVNDTATVLHTELSTSLYVAKRFDEAYAYLTEQRKRFATDPYIAVGLGRVCVRTGRREQALSLIDELQESNPAFADELRTMMKQ
jgi:Flp pilus assembly protein TadD